MEQKRINELMEICKKDNLLTKNTAGDDMVFIDNGTFQLLIPKNGNTPEHGEFFINSLEGHYCFSYSDVSTHTYHVLDGDGTFIVGDEQIPVKSGATVTIKPNTVYTYMGKMLLIEEMEPNFIPECEHEIGMIDYSKEDEENHTKGSSK